MPLLPARRERHAHGYGVCPAGGPERPGRSFPGQSRRPATADFAAAARRPASPALRTLPARSVKGESKSLLRAGTRPPGPGQPTAAVARRIARRPPSKDGSRRERFSLPPPSAPCGGRPAGGSKDPPVCGEQPPQEDERRGDPRDPPEHPPCHAFLRDQRFRRPAHVPPLDVRGISQVGG